MTVRFLAGLVGLAIAIVSLPLFAAFEARVVNVSAVIENALYVHPQSLEFGTVFPEEKLVSSFFITFSQSFSESDQWRVGTVEYAIKQYPKPRPAAVVTLGGLAAARNWCQSNSPVAPDNPSDSYYVNCYPTICPALGLFPDGRPTPGNDLPLLSFHDSSQSAAFGKLVKFNANGSTIGNDPSDVWDVNLAVPCFAGQCGSDWTPFVFGLNPAAGNPLAYQLPRGLEHDTFGCDLWIQTTAIY